MLACALLTLMQTGFVAVPDPEWTAVFDRTHGWTGADGVYSFPLDGVERPRHWQGTMTGWVFSDTFIGDVSPSGQRLAGTTLVNNTMAIQPAGGGPDPNAIRFLWDRSGTGSAAMFKPNTPNTQAGQFYWMKDGIAIGDQFHIFAARFDTTPPPFFRYGISLLTLDLNGLGIPPGEAGDSTSVAPGWAPPQPTQLETPLYAPDAGNGSQIAFGGAILDNTASAGAPFPDGYVYVYGIREDSLSKKCLVARVPKNDFTNFGMYRYWDGATWSANLLDSDPVCGRVSTEMSVTPLPDGRFLMVFMLDTIGGQIAVRVGDTPTGPWSNEQVVYTVPLPQVPAGVYSYHAKAHPHLSDARGLLVSYNVNTFGSFWDHFSYADIYRPRFVRIRPQ